MWKRIQNYFNRRRLKDSSYDWLFEPYSGDEVVVFDTETTGLNPRKDEILSIGAVKIKGNKILTSESFEIFLKPSRQISIESIKIHHIRPCDIDNAEDTIEGIKKFLKFIENRPLVGYYLEFDIAMINKILRSWIGISLPNLQTEVSGIYFDKKTALIPQGHIDLRFDTILDDLNIPRMGKHNALNDAIMTAMVYLKLKNINKLNS